jgi:hypothetical protein
LGCFSAGISKETAQMLRISVRPIEALEISSGVEISRVVVDEVTEINRKWERGETRQLFIGRDAEQLMNYQLGQII